MNTVTINQAIVWCLNALLEIDLCRDLFMLLREMTQDLVVCNTASDAPYIYRCRYYIL